MTNQRLRNGEKIQPDKKTQKHTTCGLKELLRAIQKQNKEIST